MHYGRLIAGVKKNLLKNLSVLLSYPMNIFKQIRNAAKLTQTQMAERVGVVQGSIVHYEFGRATPRPPAAWKYIDIAREHDMFLTLENLYPRP